MRAIKRQLIMMKLRLLILWYSISTDIASWLFRNIGLSRREDLPNEASYQLNGMIWGRLYNEVDILDKLKYHYIWELQKRIKYWTWD